MYSLRDEYLRFERRDVRFNTNPRSVSVCVTTEPQIPAFPTPFSSRTLDSSLSLSLSFSQLCATLLSCQFGTIIPATMYRAECETRVRGIECFTNTREKIIFLPSSSLLGVPFLFFFVSSRGPTVLSLFSRESTLQVAGKIAASREKKLTLLDIDGRRGSSIDERLTCGGN